VKDPVVKNIDEWINRSAGQHRRRWSEGTQQIPHQQTDEEAANLKAWRASGLRRVDTSQLGQRDGVSVGACRTDLPVDFAGPEPREFDTDEPLMTLTELFVIVLIVGACFGLALKFYMP